MQIQKTDTHILCRETKYLSKSFILGITPIEPDKAEILFEGQRVMEAQWTHRVGCIVLLTPPPPGALYVADTTYLLPPSLFNKVEDVSHFLVNMPFCKAVTTDFFDIFNLLTTKPELLTENAPFLIGCIHEQARNYAEVSPPQKPIEPTASDDS